MRFPFVAIFRLGSIRERERERHLFTSFILSGMFFLSILKDKISIGISIVKRILLRLIKRKKNKQTIYIHDPVNPKKKSDFD
jgi:hypothetical protein